MIRGQPTVIDFASPHDRGTGWTRHSCPVDECGWFHDEPLLVVGADVLAGSVWVRRLGAAIAANDRAQRIEKALREHFDEHSVLEWLRTIVRLRAELAKAKP